MNIDVLYKVFLNYWWSISKLIMELFKIKIVVVCTLIIKMLAISKSEFYVIKSCFGVIYTCVFIGMHNGVSFLLHIKFETLYADILNVLIEAEAHFNIIRSHGLCVLTKPG